MSLPGLNGLPVTKPEGLTDITFQLIRDGIVNKAVAPGSRVTESALAQQIGVSKTPVREALIRLRHIGLLEEDDGSLRVVLPSEHRVRCAYEYRESVEATAARVAGDREDAGGLAELADAARASLEAARAGDRMGFRDRDREFHGLIAERTQNPFLERAVKEAVMLTSALRQRDSVDGGDSVSCGLHHTQIADAIQARDSARAARVMADHIRAVADIVLRSAPEVQQT